MRQDAHVTRTWIKTGVVCGLLVSVTYPLLVFLPMPRLLQVVVVMAFGPLLGIASAGLFQFITLHKRSVSASIAVVSNIVAGVLFSSMVLVQMAIRSSKPEEIQPSFSWMWKSINEIHLGLDVAWDLYIFLGTFLFALSMFGHPKLGRVLSAGGIVISLSLLSLNVIAFPVPPADSGLVDVGPLVGLWYLAVTIAMTINYNWVKAKTAEPAV